MYSTHTRHYPTSLEIESTSRCNINPPCPMCARALRSVEDEKDMSDHSINWMSNALKNAKYVSLHGVGEPLFSKKFETIIDHSGQETLISFNSNGQIMTDKVIHCLLKRPISSIMFSLDAATEQTYHKIRGYGSITLQEVKDNIKRLFNERNKRGLVSPILSTCMVIMKENYKEMLDFVQMSHDIGCSGVYVWPLSKPSVPSDYLDHERNGWIFRYTEQSNIPITELKSIIDQCYSLSKRIGIDFNASR